MNLKVLATIVLIATPAAAENDFTHSGAYIQGAGLAMISAFESPDEPSDTDPTGWGFMGGVGYRFSPWFAAQVDYQWGEMEDELRFVSPVTDVSASQTAESWTIMASGKVYPFASSGIRFQPYALVGFGVLNAENSTTQSVALCSPICAAPVVTSMRSEATGFAMKYGGGADIHLSDRIYVFVDYAFNHSIQDSIKPFDFHAVGGGVGFRW